jgi:hypothetical protein
MFEPHKRGVSVFVSSGGDEQSISFEDKRKIVERSIDKALEIPKK